ncbi:hypothetical protein HDV06_001495 [Boothiomyces sp. JEL0866]|nr:hypothetical protein HDV06_001495 [Boothiomyces sp. JEL0866]
MSEDNEIIEDIKEQIFEYQSLGKEGYETNTTAIVNALLEICGKTRRNKYIIKEECILKAVSKTVIYILADKKADKIVSKRVDKPVRGQVNIKEKPILVIECKHHDERNKQFDDDDINQLFQYMTGMDFPSGMLISEFRVKFYKKTHKGINETNEKDYFFCDDIDEIINHIKNIDK